MIFQNCLNFTRLTAREITYNNFEISLVVFMPNITTNHAITYTNTVVLKINIFLFVNMKDKIKLKLREFELQHNSL